MEESLITNYGMVAFSMVMAFILLKYIHQIAVQALAILKEVGLKFVESLDKMGDKIEKLNDSIIVLVEHQKNE